MNIKTALRDLPPDTVILSRRRRISVREAYERNAIKYQWAGRSRWVKMKAIGFRLPAAGWFRLDAFGFISRNSITVMSGLRPLSPLWCLRHHLSPRESVSLGSQVAIAPLRTKFACHPAKAGAQQPMLYLEPLMNTKVRGALFCHRLRGKSREADKGEALFRRP